MKIALLGDIALFGRLSYKSSQDIDYYFEEVSSFLETMDYVVGNLETPFSVKKKTSGAKSAYIYSDVENIKILKSLHIKAVSLANNHMFDFGKEGYEVTKRLLNENGIEWFGTEGKEITIEKDDCNIDCSATGMEMDSTFCIKLLSDIAFLLLVCGKCYVSVLLLTIS